MSEIVKRKVRVPLSEAETADIGRELAAALANLEALRLDAKDSAKHHKNLIDGAELRVSTLGEAITSGEAVHEVDCEVMRDHAMKRIAYVRVDTQEVVEVRDMTIEEQQMVLGEDKPSDDTLRERIQTFLGVDKLPVLDELDEDSGPDDDVSEVDSGWDGEDDGA